MGRRLAALITVPVEVIDAEASARGVAHLAAPEIELALGTCPPAQPRATPRQAPGRALSAIHRADGQGASRSAQIVPGELIAVRGLEQSGKETTVPARDVRVIRKHGVGASLIWSDAGIIGSSSAIRMRAGTLRVCRRAPVIE